MFSWKRQRKEEPERPVEEAPEELAPATPLGCSPAGPAALLPLLCPSTASACSGASAAGAATMDGCASSSGALAGAGPGPGSSIELAARVGSGGKVLEQASVRSKAAFFEALISANTTTHVVCTAAADGTQQCSYPGTGPASAGLPHLALCASSSGGGGGGDGASGAAGPSPSYSEVHMVLRMPHAAAAAPPPAPSSSRYGSAREMEVLIDALHAQLELKERQRQAAVDAYTRRTGECENLMCVVRELTESRSKSAGARAGLAERYNELQAEYHRMLRIADLSRTVSKENLATTSRTRSELRRAQSELHAVRAHACSLADKCARAKQENAALKEKVALLERLDFEGGQESEVMKHHTRWSRLAETY